MVDTVWTVRHGQRTDVVDPAWKEAAERVHDPPLTDHGRWEAWRVGRRLAETGVDFEAIYASPFLRCVETAEEICRELDREFVLEPGLGEHRNDEWFDAEPELLDPEAHCERFEPCAGLGDPVVHPEFPESHDVAERRVGEAVRGLVERHAGAGEREADARNGRDGDHLLVVGHGLTIGGVVRGLVGSTEHVEAPLAGLTRVERRERSSPSSVSRDSADQRDGDWALCYSGDTLHR